MKQWMRRWTIGLLVLIGVVLPLLYQSVEGMAVPSKPLAARQERLVDIRRLVPKIRLDIRYATTNNFTQTQLYRQPRCVLRASVANRLAQVQADLATEGFGLKLYDCYRPLSVQRKMWEIVPDGRYVANPSRGSRHNRGAAVDLALVDRQGNDLPMPTDFDDFSERAWRTSREASSEARENSQILEAAMVKRGFIPLETEWWHFDGPGWEKFPVIDTPLESVGR
jgi:zinc D-Ala-D-Ala dipeptidase